MNRVRRVGMVMAMMGLCAVGAAQAQGPGPRGDGDGRGRGGPGGPAGRGGGAMMLPVRELVLTEAQREQVEEIRRGHREATQAARKAVREAEKAQRAAVQTVPLNESLVRSTAQGLALAQSDMDVQEARIFNDVWQLLTPEQQAKLRTLHAAPRQR